MGALLNERSLTKPKNLTYRELSKCEHKAKRWLLNYLRPVSDWFTKNKFHGEQKLYEYELA